MNKVSRAKTSLAVSTRDCFSGGRSCSHFLINPFTQGCREISNFARTPKTCIKKFIVCVASKTADLLPALSSSVRYGMTTSSVSGNKKHLRRLAKASMCEVRRALLSKVALDFPPRIVRIPDSVSEAPAWHSHLPDSDPCQLRARRHTHLLKMHTSEVRREGLSSLLSLMADM